MDKITIGLDDQIVRYRFESRPVDVACYNKIKMDYFLILTIAATWDIRHVAKDEEKNHEVMKCLQRPETGKLIRSIDSVLGVSKEIVKIFDSYKEGRNLLFGHTTFEGFEAERLNAECEQCWQMLMSLPALNDYADDLIRKLYQEQNDFYYIANVKQNGEMLVKQRGKKNAYITFPLLDMKARMENKENDVQKGDLFISADDKYIKVSPFIQYNEDADLFMMLMDIESSPLAFKMAYIYRTPYANDSVKYLDEFPRELRSFFPEEPKKVKQNGVEINSFSQYGLFNQDYYYGIHRNVQKQLDQFIIGNMAYGAVRGVGGVGKTSAVFMWMKRILGNEDGVLDVTRKYFDLRRIIFLSAKSKIYSREINSENLSNFYDIESDVHNYRDVIETVYSIFFPSEKRGLTFNDKVKWIKRYSNPNHGILIIIDDYESLPEESRNQIQSLKDSLKPNVIKMLITTRFASKESKDIIVERLDENDCSEMTDHIFGSPQWRADITPHEMHRLTGGLPLLIWYAKAYFRRGQLSSERLKGCFSGPAAGLEGYLYDNFVQCFESSFTQNFLMIASRYYELHNDLQISKKTAIFLCSKDLKEYKPEDEEFLFRELTDLKLITINQTTNSVDFSPLMLYMDKSSKKQKPSEQYQEDALKVLTHLDEENHKDLFAVIESAEYLEDATKCRLLCRVVDFPKVDENVKAEAIKRIFDLSENKIQVYADNMPLFQNNPVLMKSMITYLLDATSIIADNYNLVRDFVKSVATSLKGRNDSEQIAYKSAELVHHLIAVSYEERELQQISNSEIKTRMEFLCNVIPGFVEHMKNARKRSQILNVIEQALDEVAFYAPTISNQKNELFKSLGAYE